MRAVHRKLDCRGSVCTTHETDRICTGFSFGSRRTQRISARIYDKTAEMEAKGTDWWEAVWGQRHREGAPVWRIEFEIGRGALTELQLFTPEAVLASVPSLWRYCSTEWLSLRSPGPDSNRSRWPVAAKWETVRSPSLVHGATALSFIRRRWAAGLRSLFDPYLPVVDQWIILDSTDGPLHLVAESDPEDSAFRVVDSGRWRRLLSLATAVGASASRSGGEFFDPVTPVDNDGDTEM